MRRFFVEDISPQDAFVIIKGAEFVHLKKVLRLKQGAEIAVFNGAGLELSGTIEALEKGFARVRVGRRVDGKNESPVEITVIQGLVKGHKPELIIQKATELGVQAVLFYGGERSVPQINRTKNGRLIRWRKVAIEAAKQCGRAKVPAVSAVEGLQAAMESLFLEKGAGLLSASGQADNATGSGGFIKLIFWEGADKKGVKELLKGAHGCKQVAALVGPEGGFTEAEIKEAVDRGFILAGLGPRILRSETAGIAAVAIIQYELGDVN